MPDCSPELGAYANPSQAILALRQALAADPGSRTLALGLAALYLKQQRFEEAQALLLPFLAREPEDEGARFFLAWACMGTGQLEDMERILGDHPNTANWCAELGVMAADLEQWPLATRLFAKAVSSQPSNGHFRHSLCMALDHEHRFQESLTLLAEELSLYGEEPARNARIRFHLAENMLRLGWLESGWDLLESRFAIDTGPRLEPLPLEPWTGGDLAGRHILIRAEQGFGDVFMLIRYAKLLARQGATVLIEPQPRCGAVLATCPGVAGTVSGFTYVPARTLQAPIMSLPRLCGTRLASIPAEVPYLRVPDQVPSREALDACLAQAGPGRKIGLIWAGNPGHLRDKYRSLPPELLDVLREVPETTWFSLQMGEVPRPDLPMVDLAPHLASFSDTAYVLQALDGLIAVDTGPVHLAGALARPVWLLLPWVPDWRWLLDRRDSPWYPTLELWRQPAPGDWASVFAQMTQRLKTSGFP